MSRADAIGRTTLELGHWSDEAQRADFLELVPGQLPPARLRFNGGITHLVRMHVALVRDGGEELLLVQVVQADQGAWRFAKDGDRWRVYLLLEFPQAMNAEVNLRTWSLPKNEPTLVKELK